ncbi:MAG TPA: decarboxylating 6-phosphogluconate dehydrogenase [Steroidobacteraceae bacterium]|nr:decarboxylating 6-phosphogluconate dehydrogenase [Steroidobacteraceae bacterium]
MQLGMIGLGRMGANMVRRLQRGGHQCVAFDRSADAVKDVVKDGARGTGTLADFVAALATPRAIWIMVPAGIVDKVLADLRPLLQKGDIIIDGGNSHYHDDIRRAAELRAAGLHYVDVGTSGGVLGLERGFCLMIGGEPEVTSRLAPIFATLSPGEAPSVSGGTAKGTAAHGYLHCGGHGAGHFVKMVHNGIEYGLMAAYAEGLNILEHANAGLGTRATDAETAPLSNPAHFQYEFDVAAVAELWRHGSIVGSALLDLTAAALAGDPKLQNFAGRVADSGEGRWTLQAAIEEGVPAYVLSAALYSRFASRDRSEFADKVLSAMRLGFGGHQEGNK